MNDKVRDLQAGRRRENRATFLLMSTPDGVAFMEAIEGMGGKVLRKSPDGVVDPYAMAYAAGQNDLIQTIKDMINDGKLAR
jgi:hypothetical protein